jgi:uncharacterized OB-fold protein
MKKKRRTNFVKILPDGNRTYKDGRRCPDCGAYLNIYNPERYCSPCRQKRLLEGG